MATKGVRAPLLRALAKRNFAASAAEKPSACGSTSIEVSTLSNKTVVASADCANQGIVKVAVAVRAGSRYESPDNLGASHIVRSAAGLSTCEATHFGIVRNLQQMGATLTATSDRETIVYTLETTCNHLEKGLKYLKYVTAKPAFKPWELNENIPRIKYELAGLPLRAKLLDYLHRAAYRTGLGNSIFAREYNLKNLNSETIQHFVGSTFLSSRTSVAGVGIDHGTLTEFAEDLDLSSGSSDNEASTYHGGEIRSNTGASVAHVVIAGEASGLLKKEVFAYAVLRNALGGGPSVSWGRGAGPLSQAITNIRSPCAAQAVSIAHSDAGLFGVLVTTEPDNAGYAVEAAVKVLQGEVTDEDVERGKAMLTSSVLFSGERCDALVADMAQQGVIMGKAKEPSSLVKSISAVTTEQVKAVLNNVLSGPKTMASIGGVNSVPYLDQLF